MATIEYFVGLASGVLFAVIIPLFIYGHKMVDDKRSTCDQRLVQLINSLAQKVAKSKTLEEEDKTKLYTILEVYAFCDYYFGMAWKVGLVTVVLLYASATFELWQVNMAGTPLSLITGLFAALGFMFFIMFLWQLMSAVRRQI